VTRLRVDSWVQDVGTRGPGVSPRTVNVVRVVGRSFGRYGQGVDSI